MRSGDQSARHQAGFTYVTVLLLVTLMSLALAIAAPRWSDAQQHAREDELLRIGQLYATAIASYYEQSPGTRKRYPESLDDLLLDGRMVGTKRHLRKLYPDPMLPGQALQVVRDADGGIQGVFSASTAVPIRQGVQRFQRMAAIPRSSQYRQWIFIAEPKT
jgi:type II secretory pathway pseudopilin PulG